MPNNIIEFKSLSDKRSKVAFCLVDKTSDCANGWIRELVVNQAEYTISNVVGKFYDLFQGLDEDSLLNRVTDLNYEYAVVFTTGTEFINGYSFFEKIDQLTKTNTALAGHVLDRGDAYYELHHQCYFINLECYKNLNRPTIGKQELLTTHEQIIPHRSQENFHDNYTPIWMLPGEITKVYKHKCHGWNILSKFLEHNLNVEVFDQEIKNSKLHLYPEYVDDFNKNISWLYKRQMICANEFVHTSNTEWEFNPSMKFKQIVTPASGTWYDSIIDPSQSTTIIFYDYNQKSLDYWKQQLTVKNNITYKFILLDLLVDEFDIRNIIDLNMSKETVINFSNIFFYEGTASFYNMNYRLYKENQILENIKQHSADTYVSFNMRSAGAFGSKQHLHGQLERVRDIELIQTRELTKPTWRFNQEWL